VPPAGFITFEQEAFAAFEKLDTVGVVEIDPGRLFFIVEFCFGADAQVDIVQFKIVLPAVHPLHPELPGGRPVRLSKILIAGSIEIGPYRFYAIDVNDTYFYFGIFIACFGITLVFDPPMLPVGPIDGENGYL